MFRPLNVQKLFKQALARLRNPQVDPAKVFIENTVESLEDVTEFEAESGACFSRRKLAQIVGSYPTRSSN